MIRRPPRSTRTDTLFPYTTLFRSLRMADATLPGTDLLLSRTPEGWVLRADVRSRSSFDAIREAAPELARRFAERNLGTLSIDPHFHGPAPAPRANPRSGPSQLGRGPAPSATGIALGERCPRQNGSAPVWTPGPNSQPV